MQRTFVHSKLESTFSLRGLAIIAAFLVVAPAMAQNQVFRCGSNEYIDNAEVAKARGCKPMDGGNITIVKGTQPQRTDESRPAARTAAPAPVVRSGGERVDSAAQRARDSDAKSILEAELKKAEERLAQAKTEYADGAPEKQGIEGRNHQRYLDRVAELKAALARAESDVASIKRELARVSGGG